MCLAVPLKITRIIDDFTAMAASGSEEIQINISLLEDPKAGEFVIVHAGFAMSKVHEDEAAETLKLLKELEGYANE
ncbi:MAG: HypC/HybG/HupF family hydrogenase formation chaperone [Spirochaetales bacterium]|nr:HypC/HybG/HupF family hydrogenase formation chaperone [Spirochaetales bacterium]